MAGRRKVANRYLHQEDFEFEYEGRTYYAEVGASAYYNYIPGTMFRRNGDPGDPPELVWDVLDVKLYAVQDAETGDMIENIPQGMIDTVWGMLEDDEGDYEWTD